MASTLLSPSPYIANHETRATPDRTGRCRASALRPSSYPHQLLWHELLKQTLQYALWLWRYALLAGLYSSLRRENEAPVSEDIEIAFSVMQEPSVINQPQPLHIRILSTPLYLPYSS